MFKKLIVILLCISMLFGCSKEKKIVNLHDYINDEKITTLNNDNLPELLVCYLGSGSIKYINDLSVIREIFNGLQEIEIYENDYTSDLHIDDGDMGFVFTLKDGTEITYSFLTSEYYRDGDKYLSVVNPNKVNDLLDIARYAEEKTDDITLNKINTIETTKGLILLDYIDNGDEAANVLVLKPNWNNEELYIENVYSVEEILETDNGILLTCKVGDYYSHEEEKNYLLKIKDDKLEIEEVIKIVVE